MPDRRPTDLNAKRAHKQLIEAVWQGKIGRTVPDAALVGLGIDDGDLLHVIQHGAVESARPAAGSDIQAKITKCILVGKTVDGRRVKILIELAATGAVIAGVE